MDSNLSDREKWDRRYLDGSYADRSWPSAYLDSLLSLNDSLPKGGRALDLACGRGRNSIFLARNNFLVDAIDISPVALRYAVQESIKSNLSINWVLADLMEKKLPMRGQITASYDLIVMFRFVSNDLLESLVSMLAPNGVLISEQHLVRSQKDEADRIVGPSSNRFRVEKGSLKHAILKACSSVDIVDEFEGLVQDPDGEVAQVSRVCVTRRG